MSREGYIYLLHAAKPFDECFKIGRTAKPQERLQTFAVKLPYKVTPLVVAKVEDMFAEEAWLHSQYSAARVAGEWFKLTERDVEIFKAYYLVIEADRLFGRLAERLHAHWNEELDEDTAGRYIGMSVRLSHTIARAGIRLRRRYAFLTLSRMPPR